MEFGIELPANTTYEVHVETQNKRHLVIPVKPDLELSEEDLLKSISGGGGTKPAFVEKSHESEMNGKCSRKIRFKNF